MTASNSNSIQSLTPYDILCGRGKVAYNNVGNRRFRVTMTVNLEAYMVCKSKIQRTVLVGSIVDYLIEEAGARFLKPKKGCTGCYVEMNENQAREKVAHALRDMAVAKKQTAVKEWNKPMHSKKRVVQRRRDKLDLAKQEQQVNVVVQRQKDILEAMMKKNEILERDDFCLKTPEPAPSGSCSPQLIECAKLYQPYDSCLQFSKDTLSLLDKIADGDWSTKFSEQIRSDCFIY